MEVWSPHQLRHCGVQLRHIVEGTGRGLIRDYAKLHANDSIRALAKEAWHCSDRELVCTHAGHPQSTYRGSWEPCSPPASSWVSIENIRHRLWYRFAWHSTLQADAVSPERFNATVPASDQTAKAWSRRCGLHHCEASHWCCTCARTMLPLHMASSQVSCLTDFARDCWCACRHLQCIHCAACGRYRAVSFLQVSLGLSASQPAPGASLTWFFLAIRGTM